MKLGLVIEGGGLRSAFAAGALKTLAEAGVAADTVTSGGVGAICAAYARAGQLEALENLYGTFFDQHGELSRLEALQGERAVDGAEFLATVTEAAPLDMAAFAAAPASFYVSTTRADNGDGVFWRLGDRSEWKQLRPYLEATVAQPGKDQPVSLVERSYYAGPIAEPLPIAEALRQDCDKLLVIQTHPLRYNMPRQRLSVMMQLALRGLPDLRNAMLFSHLHDAQERRQLHQLQLARRAVVIAPLAESTSYKRYGVSRSAAAEFYAEGLRLTTKALPRLKDFLEAE
ncbi:MAG: hypothetical protein Q4C56_05165 [Peptococcaceae bacterium]|nr:hypothetical protein [Peptococcaceae bacterium]